MSDHDYDVAIVGAGFSSALMAKRLAEHGCRVVVLEAGNATGQTWTDYQGNLSYFYESSAKVPNSPWVPNPVVPTANVLDIQQITPGTPSTSGYLVQTGPLPFSSDYQKEKSGTSLHWLGMTFRMLPGDFEMKSRYGLGVDWAIPYEDMNDDYEQAEFELGVAGEVEDQTFHGIRFREGYVYPMHSIPMSYQDQWIGERLGDDTVRLGDDEFDLEVRALQVARNSIPNPAYDGGKGYRPVGAVGAPGIGERCEGNASCIPICPVQAKWNAGKTWASIPAGQVEVRTQTLVTKVLLSGDRKKVVGLQVQPYGPTETPAAGAPQVVTAQVYVVATHAIEAAKLLLASDAANSSDQLGRNLMDHPYLLTWGLAPENIGAFRGPSLTSTFPAFLDGGFRSERAAWRVDVDNWGWSFAAFSPGSDIETKVRGKNLYGKRLRDELADELPRQMRFGFLVEQLPEPSNRVTIDQRYLGPMGVPRPVISYDVGAYSRKGMVAAREFTRQVYERLNVSERTAYQAADPGYMQFEHEALSFHGAGHVVGTHRLGESAETSVTDTSLRSWDHENLFVVGCGSMPTIGTSNPSLTMAALVYRSTRGILSNLGKL